LTYGITKSLTELNNVELGHRLKLFRVASGLTQAETAKRLSVSQNYVYMIESGRREPSLEYVRKFSNAVSIPMAVIFLEPAKRNDAKTRKLVERLLALMAEYAKATVVKNQ
jgi:transcriptional regulator with XRE-family HTH domain